LVYQGYGRGLDLPDIEMVNKIATQNLGPDLTILLDISPEQGLMRRHSLEDRFEQEALSFHRSVREGYVKLAAVDPDHWLVIDASLPKQKIVETIWETVSKLLPNFSA